MGPSDSTYFRTLLSLLDLRLFTCLGTCPGESRDEAHGLIAEISDHDRQEAFVPDNEEIAVCEALTDALISKKDEILRSAESLPAIEVIRDRFGLNREEMLLLTAILAPIVDGRFRQLYKLFQNSDEPRMDFLLSLIETDGFARYKNTALLRKDGKLLSRGLAVISSGAKSEGSSATFRPAPGLIEWLNGVRSGDAYDGRAEYREVSDLTARQGEVFLSASMAIEMSEISAEPVPIVSFYGPDHELLMEHAEALAAEIKRPVLILNLNKLEVSEAVPLIRTALRDCALNRALLTLFGFDAWNDADGFLPSELGRLLAEWDVPVILLSEQQAAFSLRDFSMDRLNLRVSVARLTGAERLQVWKKYLRDIPLEDGLDEASLRTLAGQFTLTVAQIRSAVKKGLEIAVIGERDLTLKDLYEGARLSSIHHLSDLAKKMPARYLLNDLILPERQKEEIEELIAMGKNRSQVLEEWGVGEKLVSGRGISALFTGAPGTGKTLAAQVIAGELGLDLYRIDLSTVVSKYIGETEKNLEKIFSEAQNTNVILFFDEADSLFGRRSEVNDSHDRYANIEVGYLLQRIETYDGIVLMATNLGANLDEAFTRRINYIIDFPFPDEEIRLRLWKLLLPDNIEKEPDIDLASFASSYKIAGGNIRNAVVWAIYDSARNKHPLTREDLLHGVEREYRKMGKVFIAMR